MSKASPPATAALLWLVAALAAMPVEAADVHRGEPAHAPRDGSGVPGPPGPFDQTLTLHGLGWRVTSANQATANSVTIVPTGLSIDNSPIVRSVDGQVVGAEVADLDRDGSPEIYVYLKSAGSGSPGSLLAFSANRRKSLSDIFLAPLTDDAEVSRGYRGQDEFAVVGHRLVRRFPVYRERDAPGMPSGGVRRVAYRLTPGEAGWVLKLDRVLAQ